MAARPLFFSIFILLFLLEACNPATPTVEISFQTPLLPTNTMRPAFTQDVIESTATPRLSSCEDWQSWPVIPTVGERMRALYRGGQTGGNDSQAFSKIGDGEISAAWFFTAFDLGAGYYDLGPFEDLSPVIAYFSGSFGRMGVAARRGFNTGRILDPAFSDAELCHADESPLACELRLQRPAFGLISLGTNQVWQPEEFESGLRQIVELLLSKNVLPILSTKGDNLEGDHRINRTIACLAEEYEVPLWNFWSAIQPLPAHGLQPDLEHLTYGITDFDDEQAMRSAWTVRNLTALQALDAVWRGVTAP